MKLPGPAARRPREPIGPLVDIVFLLLVFFLLAGTLAPVSPLEVRPPSAAGRGATPDAPLRVQLAADGRLGLDGEVLGREALAAAITARLGATATPRAVEIEADGDAPSGAVLELLALLRTAGAERLALVTIAEAGRRHD